MTREKEIQSAINMYAPSVWSIGHEETIPFTHDESIISSIAFTKGVQWADNNPKSFWINVKDDLPCNHKELLNAMYETKKVFILKPGGFPDINYMLNVDGKWVWFTNKSPEFWMPIPKSPKE